MLEGVYAHLPRLGFPLSVAVELQSSNLRFDSAKWSTRQSGGGFSVTFWPSLPGGRKATNQSNPKRNRRRRNRKSKSLVHLSPCRDSTTISKPVSVPETSSSPFIAHQRQEAVATKPLSCSLAKGFTAMLSGNTTTTQSGKSSSEEDDSETEQSQLSSCDAADTSGESEDLDNTQDELEQLLNAEMLEFEIRRDVPGVKSTISGECNWTPVSIKKPSLTDEFDTKYLKNCKGVGVVKVGSMLRARIQTKSATFFTPIATRTRSRTAKFKSRLNELEEPLNSNCT